MISIVACCHSAKLCALAAQVSDRIIVTLGPSDVVKTTTSETKTWFNIIDQE